MFILVTYTVALTEMTYTVSGGTLNSTGGPKK